MWGIFLHPSCCFDLRIFFYHSFIQEIQLDLASRFVLAISPLVYYVVWPVGHESHDRLSCLYTQLLQLKLFRPRVLASHCSRALFPLAM
jgi:hypothetical protein